MTWDWPAGLAQTEGKSASVFVESVYIASAADFLEQEHDTSQLICTFPRALYCNEDQAVSFLD